MRFRAIIEDHRHPGLKVLAAPFLRLRQGVTEDWSVLVVAAAVWQYLLGHLFLLFMVLLLPSGLFDWWWGVKAARLRGDYDETMSIMGWHSKVAGLVLAGFVWIIEQAIVPASNGMMATAVALTFLLFDLRGIDRKRITWGGGPVPVLHQFFGLLERLAVAMFGHVSADPQRRAGDSVDEPGQVPDGR
jgi:hypothetical protein